ncbi:MAG: hypothetical protein AB7R89_18455 [Dehalococcoidia bacterium]
MLTIGYRVGVHRIALAESMEARRFGSFHQSIAMITKGANVTPIRAGLRLRSAVSDVEVIVVKAEGISLLTCCGVPMLSGAEAGGGSDPAAADESVCQLGKRYVTAGGSVELVCVKGGKGTLAADGEPLQIKAAKALPSSD